MYKFSFIVPVYNTEKYIAKCIDSLLSQDYDNYEIIIVDDGSPDGSNTIASTYAAKNKKIKIYKKTNGGLSDARNFGAAKANGDYLVFVDSDDYVSPTLLSGLVGILNYYDGIDLIKYKAFIVRDDASKLDDNLVNEQLAGEKAFVKLVSATVPFEMVWLYAYNAKFWRKNKFKFPLGKYHEDFALTPIVLLKAKTCYLLDQHYYYYRMSDNSIMRNSDDSKTKKKAYDILEHFDNLLSQASAIMGGWSLGTRKVFMSYIANAVLLKATELNGKMLDDYILEMKKRKIASYLLDDTFARKIKRLLVKFNYKFYIKWILKRK